MHLSLQIINMNKNFRRAKIFSFTDYSGAGFLKIANKKIPKNKRVKTFSPAVAGTGIISHGNLPVTGQNFRARPMACSSKSVYLELAIIIP